MNFEILQFLTKNSPEEDVFNFLCALPTLRLKVGNSNNETPNNLILNPGDTLLHIVVKHCGNFSLQCLQLFFRSGYEINEMGADNRTALFAAVEGGFVNNFLLLHDNGADTLAEDSKGVKPIHFAAMHGQLDVVRYLCEVAKFPIHTPSRCTRTALHYAVENNHKDVVGFLIKCGSNVNAQDSKSITPLHLVKLHETFEMTDILLESGANILPDINGNNFLHLIAENNNYKLLELMMKSGIHKKFGKGFSMVNAYAEMPMHLAARCGSIQVFSLLNNVSLTFYTRLSLFENGNKEYPLIVLLRCELIEIDRNNFNQYLPRCDEMILWDSDLFYQVLKNEPQYAIAFLDSFLKPFIEEDISIAFSHPKLKEMHELLVCLEDSLLAIIIFCYDAQNQQKRVHTIQLLNHSIVKHMMQLKWTSFGRQIYYFQLFASIIFLMTATIEISMARQNTESTIELSTFYINVFIWMELTLISIGAMVLSCFYNKARNIILNCIFGSLDNEENDKSSKHKKSTSYLSLKLAKRKSLANLAYDQDKQVYYVVTIWSVIVIILATFITGILMLAVIVGAERSMTAALDQFLQVNAIMQLTMASGFILWEICQLKGSPSTYLKSFWNYSQLFTHIEYLNFFNSIATFLLYINFLEILRVHEKLAPIISMALEMLKDVRNFLIMYSVFQMGLTCIYYSLLQGQPGFTSFHTAFVSTYLIMFGLADSDVMLYTLEYPKQYVLTIFFMLHYLAVVIVLLNILIATMASTSQTILDQVDGHVRLNNIRSIVITELAIPAKLEPKVQNTIRTTIEALRQKSRDLDVAESVHNSLLEKTLSESSRIIMELRAENAQHCKTIETLRRQQVEAIENNSKALENVEKRIVSCEITRCDIEAAGANKKQSYLVD
ncbi:hypothetical protein THRCLA_07748 [Thraustotheca clavata]|uniref:Ion transport domain-containing protein n=1 Tax=Thraustotheca clavata TaxID=74557 RepID=A0A1V9ZC49_9STRA|nr:hypothetical protein THRCLA_07748 [Thraustotheca clavata]